MCNLRVGGRVGGIAQKPSYTILGKGMWFAGGQHEASEADSLEGNQGERQRWGEVERLREVVTGHGVMGLRTDWTF
jgi:hypothetical protein